MWNKKLKLLLLVGMLLPSYIQAEEESFFQKILRITGISATSSGQKGVDDVLEGELWIVSRDGLNKKRISEEKNYSSPIFYGEDNTVMALSSGSLVKIESIYGLEKATTLFDIPKIAKLIDSPNYENRLLVLDNNNSLGYLSLENGKISYLEYNNSIEENKAMINYLEGWKRDYDGTSIFVETDIKRGMHGDIEWSNIFLSNEKNETKNISNCESPLNCTQPSLSKSKNFVVFIKESND